MRSGQASTTAERAALLRAVHQQLDRPVVFDDPMAALLVGDEARALLEAEPATAGT